MKQLITLFIILFLNQSSQACSCNEQLIDLPIAEMGWTQSKSEGISSLSDIIFSGKLIHYTKIIEEALSYQKQKTKRYRYEITFELIKPYKGNISDTILIRTNRGSDACGFGAKLNTDCLIFAKQNGNGFYYTYSSECCKSISKNREEKRYNKYINFLESMLNMEDGEYDFKQTSQYLDGGYPNKKDTLDLIKYTIKNGKFQGAWKITDRKGNIIEQGNYKNGRKIGTWKIVSIHENLYESITTETESITYKNGKPFKSETIIEERIFDYEKRKGNKIKRQIITKEYQYE